MKKFFLLLIMLFLPLSISASNYTFDDIKIDVPDDWYIFTKDNIKNNQDLKLLEVSEEYMNNLFASNIYRLDAIKFENDNVLEMFVLTKPTTGNTNEMNDESLKQLSLYYEQQVSGAKTEIFKANNNYIKAQYFDQNLYVIDYYCAYNNVGYTIKIQSKKPFTEEQISSYDEMVKNATFGSNESNNKSSNNKETKIDTKEVSNSALRGAIIGAVVGAIIGLVGIIIKKKNS